MSKLVSQLKEKITPSSKSSEMSQSIPKTCKAQMFEKANGGLIFKDIDVPQPGEHEVLVKVIACGVCHSDSVVGSGNFGPLPRIPGHEIVGDVVAIGSGVTKWKAGDRVGGGWHGGHDGTCKSCNRGQFQCCDNAAVNGVSREGGYAEYCTLREEAVVTIPRELDPAETAPLLCAGVTLFNSVRHMNIIAGDIVAVQGLGGLGHLGLQYVRKMGYRTVALSSSDAKRDFATKLGANDYFDGSKVDHGEELQKLGGAALIIVTAPNPKIIPSLINGLAAGGKLLILAPVGDVPVNTIPLITKSLSVHGWPSGHALDTQEAIAFSQNQGVNCMIEKFPLKDANEALKKMEEGHVRFRAVLTM